MSHTATSIVIADLPELQRAVREAIARDGLACDLNHLDVSQVTSFSGLFKGTGLCGDVSKWQVHSAQDMSEMFEGTPFNGDIRDWDVRMLCNSNRMFANSAFNQDISNWNVRRLVSSQMFVGMFENTQFCHDLSNWGLLEIMDKTQNVLRKLLLLQNPQSALPTNVQSTGLESLKNYVRLFWDQAGLADYYGRSPFGLMHFDACMCLDTCPDGIRPEDYAWSRDVISAGTGLGLKRSELRMFAKEQMALRNGPAMEMFSLDGL